MSTFAVLASGPSMSQEVADSVRALRRVVVSDCYLLAPDAEAMVASDAAWWREHPEAKVFRGAKYSLADIDRSIQQIRAQGLPTSTNSGLLGLHVAIRHGATRVLLLGLDLHDRRGLHFFGPHLRNKNPTAERLALFVQQFWRYKVPEGVEVLNCTPGSALERFPFRTVAEALEAVPC